MSAYYVFFSHQFTDASTNLCIGLIFDPFNPEQKWNERPKWQKIWLIVHLAIAAALFGYGIADKIKM